MKKKLNLLICIFVIMSSFPIYAENTAPVYDYIPGGAYMMQEDVYLFNEEYLKNPKLDVQEAIQKLLEFTQKYTKVDYKYILNAVVLGEDGYADYVCTGLQWDASHAYGPYMMLISNLTGDIIALNEPEEKIEQYMERNNNIARNVREQYFYVLENLKDNEYGAVYCDNEGQLYVKLVDESKSALLETEQIRWEKTEVSRDDLYTKIQYLWKERENLNLAEVQMYMYRDTLGIWGYDTEEEFRKKLDDERFLEDIYIQAEYYNITDFDTIPEYVENKEKTYCDIYGTDCFDNKYWLQIQEGLEQLTKKYPEYTYENLFSFVYCNYQDYINFNEELEKYIDNVPYNKNEKNPFDEESYGDPERIALKMVLEKYKILYPEKDYQELYEQYGKEINESKILSQEEKRSRYFWEVLQAEQLITEYTQKQKEEAEKKSSALAAAGIVMLIMGVGVMAVIKRRVE